jgi:hypothetical protein
MTQQASFGPSVNGPGAAAILAAGIGSLTLGILAFAADAVNAIARASIIWTPTGPLSGVTTGAILVWLLAWLVLGRRWRRREVDLVPVNIAAFVMLIAALLLTFPPFGDMLQGR